MALTIRNAPFGREPGGAFNFSYESPAHVIYFEDSPRRVRAELGGRVVADSRRMKLLHETGHLPVYYFPRDDVDMDLLEQSASDYHCPFKGDARLWTVRAGEELAADAGWSYPDPLPGAPQLRDYIAFDWDAMDRWLEEDEEIFGHPRDPYTRVDVRETSRNLRVTLDGEVLAESRRPKLLFETSLPPRLYVPRADLRTDRLVRSHTESYCPYKGRAAWWSTRVGDELVADVGWSYADPFPEASKIRDHVSFLHERLEIEFDGERVEQLPHRR